MTTRTSANVPALSQFVKNRLNSAARAVRERQTALDAADKECAQATQISALRPQKDERTILYNRIQRIAFLTNQATWGQNAKHKITNTWNNITEPYLNKHGLMHDFSKLDLDWIRDQCDYLKSLPLYDLVTVRNYTVHGDVLANSMMRRAFDGYVGELQALEPQLLTYFHTITPSECSDIGDPDVMEAIKLSKNFSSGMLALNDKIKLVGKIRIVAASEKIQPSFFRRIIKIFINDLQRVIMNAPPVPKGAILYRGVKSPFYQLKSKKGVYKNEGFVSTSLSIDSAARFLERSPVFKTSKYSNDSSGGHRRVGGMKQEPTCCMQRLNVRAGTRALVMFPVSNFPWEIEVLLPTGTTFLLHNGRKTMYRQTTSRDTCFEKGYFVQVTDATVIPDVVSATSPSASKGGHVRRKRL